MWRYDMNRSGARCQVPGIESKRKGLQRQSPIGNRQYDTNHESLTPNRLLNIFATLFECCAEP